MKREPPEGMVEASKGLVARAAAPIRRLMPVHTIFNAEELAEAALKAAGVGELERRVAELEAALSAAPDYRAAHGSHMPTLLQQVARFLRDCEDENVFGPGPHPRFDGLRRDVEAALAAAPDYRAVLWSIQDLATHVDLGSFDEGELLDRIAERCRAALSASGGV